MQIKRIRYRENADEHRLKSFFLKIYSKIRFCQRFRDRESVKSVSKQYLLKLNRLKSDYKRNYRNNYSYHEKIIGNTQ